MSNDFFLAYFFGNRGLIRLLPHNFPFQGKFYRRNRIRGLVVQRPTMFRANLRNITLLRKRQGKRNGTPPLRSVPPRFPPGNHCGVCNCISMLPHSMQATRTALVARTDMPQQGQAYLRLLLVRTGVMLPEPLLLPAPRPTPKLELNSFLDSRMSVKSFFSTNSNRPSAGAVWLQPYLSECVTTRSRSRQAFRKRLLW